MYSTMEQIQQLAQERQQLWLKAGQQKLNDIEYWRLQQITRKLDKLWDAHRREYAAVVEKQRQRSEEALTGAHRSLQSAA